MGVLDHVNQRMGEDWNRRAREDAQYYVAFGRKRQSAEEFFASAADVLRELRAEYPRLTARPAELTALEIGCGPGRLMRPLADDFAQVRGVDVSAQMVELANENLSACDNAVASVASGSDLSEFDDDSIDFLYSYAVFQHIPSKDVVLSYLADACRVLRPGGVMKCQVSSLPRSGDRLPAVPGWGLRSAAPTRLTPLEATPNTWSGVSFQGEAIAQFCVDHDLQLLSMDGFETQYLWFCAKSGRPQPAEPRSARIAGVANTFTSDRLIPQSGRFASASLWVERLPEHADLDNLRVVIDGAATAPSYIRVRSERESAQVNVYLPPGVRTGSVPVSLTLDDKPICRTAAMRVTPAPALLPRLVSVTDGVNLLSNADVESRSIKVHIEEIPLDDPAEIRERFTSRLHQRPLGPPDVFCVDPLARRYELNLKVPWDLAAGPYNFYCAIGERKFAPVGLHIR